ncbi:MAG: hypothetical protein JW839_02130 [Candidatus Lokiarchaeota archaeon]|nr:hypothetical protein [Candidatus Lokiarchaeota archaeon]
MTTTYSKVEIRSSEWASASQFKAGEGTRADINSLILLVHACTIEIGAENFCSPTVHGETVQTMNGQVIARVTLEVTVPAYDATYTDLEDLIYAIYAWQSTRVADELWYSLDDSRYLELPYSEDGGDTYAMRKLKVKLKGLSLSEGLDKAAKTVGAWKGRLTLDVFNPS